MFVVCKVFDIVVREVFKLWYRVTFVHSKRAIVFESKRKTVGA